MTSRRLPGVAGALQFEIPHIHPPLVLLPSRFDDRLLVDSPPPLCSSCNSSRQSQTSDASIFSLPIYSHSRYPTPPTPIRSPSLYKPPHMPTPGTESLAERNLLHPAQSQYQGKPVKETHEVEVVTDPVTNRKTINHYQIIDEIGRGTHGKVKLGWDSTAEEMVAIKIVERSQGRVRLGRKGDGGENSEIKIRREIAILKKTQHPNVVKLLEVIDDARSKKVYLILEYILRGEVQWRASGDPAVLHRDRERIRRARAARMAPENRTYKERDTKRLHRSRRKDKVPNHIWSLEFEAETETEDFDEETPLKNSEGFPADDTQSPDFSSDDASEVDEECWAPALSLEEARNCFRDTVVGLDYLHWNGIIHRDIKPANLLWTNDSVTKISDFGVSFLGRPTKDEDEEGNEEAEMTGYEQDELELAKTAGTPAFFAPELCIIGTDPDEPNPPITNAIDVWSLGVTLFCFIFGRLPFFANHEYVLLNKIANNEVVIPRRRIRPRKARGHPPHHMKPEELQDYETEPVDDVLRDLIRRLLEKDPSKRITLKEVKHHPWVLRGIDEPEKWIDATDPEKSSRGNKIEVTDEDVEAAVSYTSVLGRAKYVLKKASTWYRGFRKRGSSTPHASEDDSKDQQAPPSKEKRRRGLSRGQGGRSRTQLQPNLLLKENDEDKELQWMGGMRDWKKEKNLNELAPSSSNSSAGSSDTVKGVSESETLEGPQGFMQSSALRMPEVAMLPVRTRDSSRSIRRMPSSNTLRGPQTQLFRHATTGQVPRFHKGTQPPPISPLNDLPAFKECSEPVASPSNLHRMVRSQRSNDLAHDSDPSSARAVLTEALYSESHSITDPAQRLRGSVPKNTHLLVENIPDFLPSRFSPRTVDSELGRRVQVQREQQQHNRGTREMQWHPELPVEEDISSNLDSEDDYVSEPTPRQENERPLVGMWRETSSPVDELPTGLPTESLEEWPAQNPHWRTVVSPPWAVSPPIPIARRQPSSYFDSVPSAADDIVSSLSSPANNNTADSSLTNSMSYPSQPTGPSSFTSDSQQNSRRVSVFSDKADIYPDDDAQSSSIHLISRNSECLFIIDSDAAEYVHSDVDSDDSEPGFEIPATPSIIRRRRTARNHSVAVGQLARLSIEEKTEAMRTMDQRYMRNRSSSSGGSTVRHVQEGPRGRRMSKLSDEHC